MQIAFYIPFSYTMTIFGLIFQGTYMPHREVKAAQGIKIAAQVIVSDITITLFLP